MGSTCRALYIVPGLHSEVTQTFDTETMTHTETVTQTGVRADVPVWVSDV